MTAATVTTSATTHSNRELGLPRHRADPDPVRATKAVVRSYRRTLAARRRDRDSLTVVGAER